VPAGEGARRTDPGVELEVDMVVERWVEEA